jgi:hypothetical protein
MSYKPAHRELYVWQQEWELDFYRRPGRIDRDTLLGHARRRRCCTTG